MKKAISILKSHMRSYQSMVDLYVLNPNNQAVSKYTSDKAMDDIVEIKLAIAALEEVEAGRTDNQQRKGKMFCSAPNCQNEADHCYCDDHFDKVREMWEQNTSPIA